MTKKFLHIAWTILFLVQTLFCFSQIASGAKATADRNQILIGEPIQLTIETTAPAGAKINWFSPDSIPHFEFLQRTKTDTINTNKGTKLIRVIPITSFDSGHWVIPSLILTDKIATDTIPVDVGFTPFDPAQDYHDIKDIIEVSTVKKKQTWWYFAGGGLLLLVLLIYLLLKKKRIPASVPEGIVNPYEEAMEKLEKLQKEKPETKQFYSRLTDIFRVYIFRKKGILSLQKTTDDLVIQLKTIDLSKEQSDQLAQTLRLSDFVKFAKYQPEKMDDTNALRTITESIINIEKSAPDPSP